MKYGCSISTAIPHRGCDVRIPLRTDECLKKNGGAKYMGMPRDSGQFSYTVEKAICMYLKKLEADE